MLDSMIKVVKGLSVIQARENLQHFYLAPTPSRIDRINAIVHLLFLSLQIVDLAGKKMLHSNPLHKVWLAKTVGFLDVVRTATNIAAMLQKREFCSVNELRRDFLDVAAVIGFRLGVYVNCYPEENLYIEPKDFD